MGDCDAVVVGAGLGGLSAAGFLARASRRVVVVERAAEVGGHARSERRGPYTFDLAVSELPVGVDDELRAGILRHLGVDPSMLELHERLYRAVQPGLALDAPFGLDAFAELHATHFPHERDGIARFLALCDRMLEDAHRLPLNLSLATLDAAAARFPEFFRYGGATLAEVLEAHVRDPALRAALAIGWPKAGLPPPRLSFATFAQGLALAARGTLWCRGGFGALSRALAEGVERAGATILLEHEAVRIRSADGRVSGVVLADGSEIGAPVVICNAAVDRLFGGDELPARYVRKLRRLRPSSPCFVLFAATRLDLRAAGAAAETILDGSWLSVPTLHDASIAPPGEHLVTVRTLGRDSSEELLDTLEELYPGFRAELTFVGSWSSGEGPFGWENTPRQTGSRRLPLAVPIDGLYLAGHWTQPGHGAYRAILSGMHAARAVLAATGDEDAVPDFRRSAAGP